ncbi:hypothetical protein [Psychrobacter sp. I-STPA10]|uniref:hypothetical protein n=1 Tax=Psychrobacter sp. I-STPA10 TaxID=2585769 RepID=UPI001E509CED|nr:hypothetical protein [Psychrobacter sp. I-STPA10]
MDQQTVRQYVKTTQQDKQKLSIVLRQLATAEQIGNEAAAFDSMLAQHPLGREVAMQSNVPEPLYKLLTAEKIVEGESQQAIFDGISMGIAEYQHRNGGENPSTDIVLSAINQALVFTEHAPDADPKDPQFDKLSFSHHESLAVVPAAVQVTLTMGIASALPIVSQLPNPTGSNEVPLVYGDAVASTRMGVMNKGDLMDGAKAGQPYLEGRHMLAMKKDASTPEKFTLTPRVAYTKEVRANKTTKFVVDDSAKALPFLGGRVSIFVKGVEVANDKHRNHPTTNGISTLQPLDKIEIGTKSYLVKSATASLDNHYIEVIFDSSAGDVPEADDVEVEVISDYERKDDDGNQILQEPGADVRFEYASIFAYPSRAQNIATIDSITQLSNELNINWYGAALSIIQQKYYFEQYGRLLRHAVNRCLASGDSRMITFDANKTGVHFTTLQDMFSSIKVTLGIARTKLSTAINQAIGGYDLYVSDAGSAFFLGLSTEVFAPTGLAFGDQYSIYRIGTLNTIGANVYYVPSSMAVFNEEQAGTAYALMAPRPLSLTKAPFVGHVAVPPMVLADDVTAFEKSVGVYSRQAADLNPIPRYNNQCFLIELINLPNL